MKPRNSSEWVTAIGALVAILCALVDFVLGSWAVGIALLALGMVQAVGIFTKRLAYFCGWMDGRSNLVLSMAEAQRRDLSQSDFWISVMEKDASMTVDQMSKRQYRKIRERIETERS